MYIKHKLVGSNIQLRKMAIKMFCDILIYILF